MGMMRGMGGDMWMLFKRLWPLTLVALFAEWGYAIMNIAALPLYLTEPRPAGLGIAVEMIGPIISTFLIFETIFKTPMGLAGDHYGRKPVIILGLFLSGLTPLLMRTTENLWIFYPLRAIDGIGAAALWPCVFATIA